MQELNFLDNISNKEILIEILHHSVDFLIGNKDEKQSLKLCHDYGFNSPDEFMLATRTIAKHFQNCCTENVTTADEFQAEFGDLSQDLQKLVPSVLAARRPEIMRFLLRKHNAQDYPLIESFDWDVRMIMGDSSFAGNQRQVTGCTFNCRNSDGKQSILHFEMSEEKLDKFINELEKAVNDINIENKKK